MSKAEKILFSFNLILYGLLTIFSYAYVDLNLTLSKHPLVVKFIEIMQQLGYFNRQASALIYLTLIIFAFSFFIFHLWLFYKSKLKLKYLTVSTLASTIILVFAYPFLSSDLFNYLFDAKIILNYHTSPYTHRPLDFPSDEWLRFMRWVHRYSPYGPLWLGMSILPAFLGFGKFILNFLTFKIFIASFHLLNAYLIFKILQKVSPKTLLFGTAFYALNPLFLIEGVVNAHNDVVLATFLILPIYFFAQRKIWLSYSSLLLGVLIKYLPVLNLPWLILLTLHPKLRYGEKMDKIRWLIWTNLFMMVVFTWLFSSFRITVPFVSTGATQVQFQPWYLFWTMPFVSLLPGLSLILISLAVSVGAFLRYLPFLYFGDWSQPGTLGFMQSVLVIPITIAAIFVLLRRFLSKIS